MRAVPLRSRLAAGNYINEQMQYTKSKKVRKKERKEF